MTYVHHPSKEVELAYRSTRYRARTPEGSLTLRIGRRSRKLDALLARYGAECWAFVSAANPYPQQCLAAANDARHADLVERVAGMRLAHFEGEGVASDGSFSERSLLIIGIGLAEAVELGARLGQCAIVVGTRGDAPELAYCLDAPLPEDLLYGESFEGGLVFITRAAAEYVAEKWKAANTATTWGELRALSPDAYDELLEHLPCDDDGDDRSAVPADEAAFDASEIEAIQEGHWPEWPAQDMFDWMPAEIQEAFGRQADTLSNGSFLMFDPEDKDAIVARLEALGYRCVAEPELIAQACGG